MKRLIIIAVLLMCCERYPELEEVSENEIYQTGIEIIFENNNFKVSDSVNFNCVRLYSDGTRKEVDSEDLIINIDDPEIVAENSGVLNFLKEGQTNITFIDDIFLAEKQIAVSDFSKLKISEIYYDALGSDTGKEFIRIKNYSSTDLDISNFSIVDGSSSSSRFYFPEATVIASDSELLITKNNNDFESYFGYVPDFQGMSFTLNNSGEAIVLYDENSQIIDIVYIESGTSDCPEPVGYEYPDLNCNEGQSLLLLYDLNAYSWQINQLNI